MPRPHVPTLELQERRFALALFFPALAVLLLTTTVPLVYLAWNSLYRLDLSMPWLSGFTGLGNYMKMGSDPRFWNSLLLTLIYTGSTVVLQVVIGLSLALLVLRFPRGQGALRIAAILPIVLAPVVVGLFWRTLVLAPDVGLVDLVTRSLGLGSHNWLGDPQLALISVIAIHTWQWTPFAFLVLLATLATLPADVYEAARLDRASAWQRFRYITLPLIRPAIVMVLILRMMTALSAFAAIFAATGGGPGSATEILNLYAYRTSFSELNLGYGSSLAMVLMSITIAISYLCSVCGGRAHEARCRPSPDRARRRRRFRPRHLGVPRHLGPAHVVQDRARRARLPAGLAVQADARQLSRGAVRRLVDPAQHRLELASSPCRRRCSPCCLPCRRRMRWHACATRQSAHPASTCSSRRCCRPSA